MATIKEIQRSRNWGVRPTSDVIVEGHIWLVEKGQPYDLVQFSINELNKPYWWRVVRDYAEDVITEKDIKEYIWFLECGEKWGWD